MKLLTFKDDVGDTLDERMLLSLASEERGKHSLMVFKNITQVSEDIVNEFVCLLSNDIRSPKWFDEDLITVISGARSWLILRTHTSLTASRSAT